MEYIIFIHWIGEPVEYNKSYSKDEMKVFWDMYCEYIAVINKKLEEVEWFDFVGTYYEPCISTPYQREKAGQFFTPPDISDLLTAICIPNTREGRIRINDPTAGSGRCLLAAHIMRPEAYMVAEDIDHTCVLMIILNFMIHGVEGEVIWHDTITKEFFGAWKVNEAMARTGGVPHCRSMSEEEYESSKLTHSKAPVTTPEITISKQDKQSTLGGLFGE